MQKSPSATTALNTGCRAKALDKQLRRYSSDLPVAIQLRAPFRSAVETQKHKSNSPRPSRPLLLSTGRSASNAPSSCGATPATPGRVPSASAGPSRPPPPSPKDEDGPGLPILTRRLALLGSGMVGAAGRARHPEALAVEEELIAEDTYRAALLKAIKMGRGVEAAIDNLVTFDPSKGCGAASEALGGEWRLLWSSDSSEPASIARALLGPLKLESSQLLGDAAAARVGIGRVVQVQQAFDGGARVELSSGAVLDPADMRVLEIQPPFRLDVVLAGRRFNVVEAASDAEFREVNARTAEEQAAPRNRYEQSYLEESGRPGDLRISRVVEGDPVVLGTVYVHERL